MTHTQAPTLSGSHLSALQKICQRPSSASTRHYSEAVVSQLLALGMVRWLDKAQINFIATETGHRIIEQWNEQIAALKKQGWCVYRAPDVEGYILVTPIKEHGMFTTEIEAWEAALKSNEVQA